MKEDNQKSTRMDELAEEGINESFQSGGLEFQRLKEKKTKEEKRAGSKS